MLEKLHRGAGSAQKKAALLGRVDGFHQDKGAGERDKGGEVLCRLLAAQGDAFEALDLADALFGAGASFVEDLGEEPRFGGAFLALGDGGAEAAPRRAASLFALAS